MAQYGTAEDASSSHSGTPSGDAHIAYVTDPSPATPLTLSDGALQALLRVLPLSLVVGAECRLKNSARLTHDFS